MLQTSFKQFRILNLLLMTALIAVAMACWINFGLAGKAIASCIAGLSVGLVISFIADAIDDRSIDKRAAVSQVLSTIGATLVFYSSILGICVVMAISLYYLLP